MEDFEEEEKLVVKEIENIGKNVLVFKRYPGKKFTKHWFRTFLALLLFCEKKLEFYSGGKGGRPPPPFS